MPEMIVGADSRFKALGGPVRILGIGGTLRADSVSRIALQATLAMAANIGAQTVLADVRELDLPLYNPDRPLEFYPPTLTWLLEEARAADGYILCSPTYHGTITGCLKNVLDALDFLGQDTSPYFSNKVVGLMALGGGAHNVINSLHHAVRALNGIVVPTVVAVPSSAVDRSTAQISDGAVSQRLQSMVEQLIDLARRLKPVTDGRFPEK